MKKKNWWVSLLLTVMLFSFGMGGTALGAVELVAGDAQVSPGETFTVDVTINDQAPALKMVLCQIGYDKEVLTFNQTKSKAVDGTWAISAVREAVIHETNTQTGQIGIGLFGNADALPGNTAATLVEISFTIADDATGPYTLTVLETGSESMSLLKDNNDQPVEYTPKNGTVTIVVNPKITATVGANGSLTAQVGAGVTEDGAGLKEYTVGDTVKYTVVPAVGYRVSLFQVNEQDAMAQLVDNVYTFTNLQAGDKTINVEFEAIPKYTITPTSDDGGSIAATEASALGDNVYYEGSEPVYEASYEEGYEFESLVVGGEAKTLDANNQYKFAALTKNLTIALATKLKQYAIAVTVGDNGEVKADTEPTADGKYEHGTQPVYTITPKTAENYVIDQVTVGGADVIATEGYKLNEDGSATYTFPALTGDTDLNVTFKLGVFKVTMEAWEGSTIEAVPSENIVSDIDGVVTVVATATQQFKVKFDEGYELEKVVIEDEAGNKDRIFDLDDGKFFTLTVDKNYVVTVKNKLMHLVSVVAMPAQGGAVDPAGDVWVADGEALDLTITVNDGWDATLYVYPAGEMPVEAGKYTDTGDYPYAVADITSDYFVDVTFEKDGTYHSADCDMDGEISLPELMDFIELFKDSAIGGYHYDGMTLSSYIDGCLVGYAAGAPEAECTMPHSSDCDSDCFISLSEFLRTVELWKEEGYTKDAANTDCNGFVPVGK